jgi:hypothetical protein
MFHLIGGHCNSLVRVALRGATDEPNAAALHPFLLLASLATAWRRCRAKPEVVGGGGPSFLVRRGLRLLQRGALDSALPAEEKGAGAAAPSFYGEDDGRGGLHGQCCDLSSGRGDFHRSWIWRTGAGAAAPVGLGVDRRGGIVSWLGRQWIRRLGCRIWRAGLHPWPPLRWCLIRLKRIYNF